MPTLRRSKSLNDKATRQKSRSGDVVRHPKSPEPGGRTRTRTCLDNYQLLVHLRKQTDDKSRQLELAYAYGGNTQTFLRSEGAQRIPGSRPLSELHPSPSSVLESATGGHGIQQMSSAQAGAHLRQHSADECSGKNQGRVLKRQESFSEGQRDRTAEQQAQRCARPMSMFEARACSPLPSVQEWGRKDQIIQNLTDSQRCVNTHNQKLLGKIDELESENARLKEILNSHNIPYVSLPRPLKLRSHKGVPLAHEITPSPSSEPFPKLISTMISPISETSVSGYGSLTGSGYGEGHMATLEAGRGVHGRRMDMGVAEAEAGSYNDDTLPLSELSGDRVGSEGSPLASPFSSAGNSRVPTLNRSMDKADVDSIHEKLDQVLELERLRGSDRKKRIVELEQLVTELTEQRKALLERYKHVVDENEKLQTRDEHIRAELCSLLQQHGQSMQQAIRTELQQLQQELAGLGQDVKSQLEAVLTSLATSSAWGGSGRGDFVVMDREVREVMDKVVDLIGPEYLRLGRQLHVPPLELERIENGHEDFALKTRRVLQSWLRRRRMEEEKEGGSSGVTREPPVQVLTQALRDIDKDIRLFNQTPISIPERQALRNCLQCVIDHVTEPSDVMDHLITLNELSPAGITFVQEVLEENRERALCRLWHVSEYRGCGIISRLALALERAGLPHVSRKLTDELEIQNARFHYKNYHPLHEDAAASVAAQSLGSRPSPSNTSRGSRPKSGWTKPSQFEAVGLPVRPLSKSEKTTSLSSTQEDGEIVWDRQVAASSTPRSAILKSAAQRTKISIV